MCSSFEINKNSYRIVKWLSIGTEYAFQVFCINFGIQQFVSIIQQSDWVVFCLICWSTGWWIDRLLTFILVSIVLIIYIILYIWYLYIQKNIIFLLLCKLPNLSTELCYLLSQGYRESNIPGSHSSTAAVLLLKSILKGGLSLIVSSDCEQIPAAFGVNRAERPLLRLERREQNNGGNGRGSVAIGRSSDCQICHRE